MRQRKSHIAPLAFLMLILFVSPMTLKAIHHHLPIQTSVPCDAHGKSISAASGTCVVCHFEFVTFLAFESPEYHYFNVLLSLGFCEPTNDPEGNFYTSYFLRAPPVY